MINLMDDFVLKKWMLIILTQGIEAEKLNNIAGAKYMPNKYIEIWLYNHFSVVISF